MFLSGSTSQNASFAHSISAALPANAPQAFGSAGLFIPAGTPGSVSVRLYALATFQITLIGGSGNLFLRIVRGKAFTDPVVYAGVQTCLSEQAPAFIQQISAKAADDNVAVPASRFLEYTAFISTDTAGIRVGPESFNAYAFNVYS